MSFKPPVSGLIKYLSKMKGIASDKIAGEKSCIVSWMEGNCLCFASKKDTEVVTMHERCQKLPQKKRGWSGIILLFLWSSKSEKNFFFLFKAMVTLANKTSVLELPWTFSVNVLRLSICFRLL